MGCVSYRLVEVETGNILSAREVVAHNVNMIYPFSNVSASLNQTANALAKIINQEKP